MPGPFAAAAVSAGASLLGGLFKKNDAKKAAREARANALEDYRTSGVRAREAAELGGFNPLTFLGLTGGPGAMPSGVSDFTSGDVIASALANGAQAYLAYDPIYEESLRLENELTKARIDQIKGELATPAFTPATFSAPAREEVLATPDKLNSSVTQLHNGGPVDQDTSISDTGDWAQRYGEPAEWIVGPAIVLRDFKFNLEKDLQEPSRWRDPSWKPIQWGAPAYKVGTPFFANPQP